MRTITAVIAGVGVLGMLAANAPARAAAKRSIPRLPDGHPDLQGTYDLATLTPVERAASAPLVMSDEQAKKLEQLAAELDVPTEISSVLGDPGHELRSLSDDVDLIVVGSRRWGLVARVVTGGVGETVAPAGEADR